MARIRVSTVIDAPRQRVWADVRDIGSHVHWMADAESIHFTSRQREGVGTTFDCTTRVGPIRLNDRMAVTEWRDRRAMGIRHVGVVTGTGRFTLRSTARGKTRFTWDERLSYPWWLGGPMGALVSKPLLRRIWKKNLKRLKHRLEST
ncbi:MAG TPA: SRPBCC family protein [Acidimicrobiales bacterium]|nr:SRPBCC family protein [Acidimicrobiales bacterium]